MPYLFPSRRRAASHDRIPSISESAIYTNGHNSVSKLSITSAHVFGRGGLGSINLRRDERPPRETGTARDRSPDLQIRPRGRGGLGSSNRQKRAVIIESKEEEQQPPRRANSLRTSRFDRIKQAAGYHSDRTPNSSTVTLHTEFSSPPPLSVSSSTSSSFAQPVRNRTTMYEFSNRTGSTVGPLSPLQSSVSFAASREDMLPMAMSPFAAWDASYDYPDTPTPDKEAGKEAGSWRFTPESGGKRRIWAEKEGAYKIGYERDVLDLEARLHECVWEETMRHSFVRQEPGTVLDIGTGLGLWPIAMAQEWPNAQFIAADLAPCHIDLQALASLGGKWASIASRIAFQQFNALKPLPFDSGVFDLVHIRFLGLGIPDMSWANLLDEATRVLRPGGHLEIVDMSYNPPGPPSITNSFSSLLMSEHVPTNPLLAIQLHLPGTLSLCSGTTTPIFDRTWTEAYDMPAAIQDAAPTWIRSALQYKGTGLGCLPGSGIGMMAVEALRGIDDKWLESEDEEMDLLQFPMPPDSIPTTRCVAPAVRARTVEVSLKVWVARKR